VCNVFTLNDRRSLRAICANNSDHESDAAGFRGDQKLDEANRLLRRLLNQTGLLEEEGSLAPPPPPPPAVSNNNQSAAGTGHAKKRASAFFEYRNNNSAGAGAPPAPAPPPANSGRAAASAGHGDLLKTKVSSPLAPALPFPELISRFSVRGHVHQQLATAPGRRARRQHRLGHGHPQPEGRPVLHLLRHRAGEC